jgi:uncharacterized protein (DUF3084 family)
MTIQRIKEGWNVNSILITICIGMSAWTLATLWDMNKILVATVVRVDVHERALYALNTRVETNSMDLTMHRLKDIKQ